MIVGDCVVAEDSQLWQTKEFKQLTFSPESGPVPIPWFDPPLISPQPTVCAVPISVKAMDLVFAEVFGKNGDGDGDYDQSHSLGSLKLRPRPRPSYLCSSTPQCGSSFSVLVYSNTSLNQSPGGCCVDDKCNCRSTGRDVEGTKRSKVLDSTLELAHFGPHDYSALRELFLSNRPTAKLKTHNPVQCLDSMDRDPGPVVRVERSSSIYAASLSLDFLWRFIMDVGCVDTLLFIELRWMLLHKILSFVSSHTTSCWTNCPVDLQCSSISSADLEWAALTEVARWCAAALSCTREHSCCSISAVKKLREDIAQWLMALSSTLRSLAVTGPGCPPDAGSQKNSSIISRTLEGASQYALRSCLSLFSHQLAADGMGSEAEDRISFPLHQDLPQLVREESMALHVQYEGGSIVSIGNTNTYQNRTTLEKEMTEGNALNSVGCLSGFECATCAFVLLAICRLSGDGTSMRVLVLPTLNAIADAIRKLLLESCAGRGNVRAVCRLRRLSRKLDGLLATRNPNDSDI